MAEKEKMKQVVLGIHERQEEEDYQGQIYRIKVFIDNEIFIDKHTQYAVVSKFN